MAAAETLREIAAPAKQCTACGARFGVDAAFCPFDGIALTSSTWTKSNDPRNHLLVDERYEVLEPLGEGGMGTVYKVRHVTLNRQFAMKVLRRDLAGDVDLAERFLREARATAAIKHPSVVAISDFGEMHEGRVTIPWFVMELLTGETLATRIRARGPMAPALAANIAKQIAEGLAASHEANVIHRDLKPENVFLVGDEIRIVDFGAAKIIGESKLTRPGVVFGTPYYMSPEQASGEPIDGRADIYSLGVLLYEMVTGRVPFDADTYMGVLTKHMFQAPSPPVPPPGVQLGELEGIVMRALEKAPKDRYPTMSAVASVLGGTRIALAPPARSRATAPMVHRPSVAENIGRSIDRHVAAERRRRVATVGLVVGAALAAFAGALLLLAPRATSLPPPPLPVTTHPAPPVVTSPEPSRAIPPAEPSPEPVAPSSPTEAPVPKKPPPPRPRPSAVEPSAVSAPAATSAAPVKTAIPNSPENFRDPWTRP